MDGIAKSAGVSVKTIYSHFANKDELFSKVMIAACTDHLLSEELPLDDVLAKRFSWFRKANQHGLILAGEEYLRHLLSKEQLALYRVVTRDADRFPELGRQYPKNLARGKTGILTAYFRSVARKKHWAKRDAWRDACLYEALLRARVYEQALHGLLPVTQTRLRSMHIQPPKRCGSCSLPTADSYLGNGPRFNNLLVCSLFRKPDVMPTYEARCTEDETIRRRAILTLT